MYNNDKYIWKKDYWYFDAYILKILLKFAPEDSLNIKNLLNEFFEQQNCPVDELVMLEWECIDVAFLIPFHVLLMVSSDLLGY